MPTLRRLAHKKAGDTSNQLHQHGPYNLVAPRWRRAGSLDFRKHFVNFMAHAMQNPLINEARKTPSHHSFNWRGRARAGALGPDGNLIVAAPILVSRHFVSDEIRMKRELRCRFCSETFLDSERTSGYINICRDCFEEKRKLPVDYVAKAQALDKKSLEILAEGIAARRGVSISIGRELAAWMIFADLDGPGFNTRLTEKLAELEL